MPSSTQTTTKPNEADLTHIVVSFESNKFASLAFGQFDQNLAYIEQALSIDVRSRGNQVTLRGPQSQVAQARAALDVLYSMASRGLAITTADVDGALRMAASQDDQLNLPAIESKSRVSGAQIATRKKTVIARTRTQDAYIRSLEKNELVFGVGPAGTGKTYLAVAYAAQLLERGLVERIILSRPAVEAGERLGFLPGDMKEKVDPYLRPLYDALYDMMPAEKVERALVAGVIEIAPLAFMRGRTLAHSAIILDEAQNTTSMQMKMVLTRLGENGRMIITGDPSQIDLPSGMPSGLNEALGILDGVEGVSIVRFTGADVVRHPLVQRIVNAYDAVDAAKAANPTPPNAKPPYAANFQRR
jgi:phosphate starvation-inducible protein PhoH and related proteins